MMNEEKAREIVERSRTVTTENFQQAQEHVGIANGMGLSIDGLRAFGKGYLAALEGPEVKALIEGLERLATGIHAKLHHYQTKSPFMTWRECPDDFCLFALGTISAFRKSVKS